MLRLGLEHGWSKNICLAVALHHSDQSSQSGANGMDSTELMRELNASIEILLDSENYLLSLNEYMNEVSPSEPSSPARVFTIPVCECLMLRSFTACAPSRRRSLAASAIFSTSAKMPVEPTTPPTQAPPRKAPTTQRTSAPSARRLIRPAPSAPPVCRRPRAADSHARVRQAEEDKAGLRVKHEVRAFDAKSPRSSFESPQHGCTRPAHMSCTSLYPGPAHMSCTSAPATAPATPARPRRRQKTLQADAGQV